MSWLTRGDREGLILYELREYRIKGGCLARWVEVMESLVIPFQQEVGMEVVGSFVVVDEEDLYIWIRWFKDEVERKRLYDLVYGSHYCKETARLAMGEMLLREAKREVLMVPTGSSHLT